MKRLIFLLLLVPTIALSQTYVGQTLKEIISNNTDERFNTKDGVYKTLEVDNLYCFQPNKAFTDYFVESWVAYDKYGVIYKQFYVMNQDQHFKVMEQILSLERLDMQYKQFIYNNKVYILTWKEHAK